MIFQDPFSSLNPRMTVSQADRGAAGDLSKLCKDRDEYEKRASAELMDTVGLARALCNTYPHELDGGRRQRIGIARALALNPRVHRLRRAGLRPGRVHSGPDPESAAWTCRRELELTYMFITHDLCVVKHISDEIMVMYLGQCVEYASSEDLFKHPSPPLYQGSAGCWRPSQQPEGQKAFHRGHARRTDKPCGTRSPRLPFCGPLPLCNRCLPRQGYPLEGSGTWPLCQLHTLLRTRKGGKIDDRGRKKGRCRADAA